MRYCEWQTIVKAGVLVLALGALGLVLVGCSSEAPVAPFDHEFDGLRAIAFVEEQYGPDPLPEEIIDPDARPGYAFAKVRVACIASDADFVFVGSDGAVITLGLGPESSRLVIPPRALDKKVKIGARAGLFKTPCGPVRMYDFTPDGLQFSRPASLELSTNLEKSTILRLYWYNPRTEQWQLEQSATVDENGVVRFRISHFSKYAIS